MRRPTARLAKVAPLNLCGLPRGVWTSAVLLVILVGMALSPTEVSAGSITYTIVNYPTLQNGYTVTGTITTDGTTGNSLPPSDITSWDIVISKGGTTTSSFTPTDSTNLSLGFDATSTTISFSSGVFALVAFSFGAQSIEWEAFSGMVRYEAVDADNNDLWLSTLPSIDSPIATVPEPSSSVLASIGAVIAFVAYGWSRHRRVQHRLEAN
jgi:hypothetical protein